MKSLLVQLRHHVAEALVRAFGDAAAGVDPLVRASVEPKFGDYQSNVAMGLAKKLGAKPRDVAQKIVDALANAAALAKPVANIEREPLPYGRGSDHTSAGRPSVATPPDRPSESTSIPLFTDFCDPPEIAGPGFINFRLKRELLEMALAAIPPAPAVAPVADSPSLALRAGTADATTPTAAAQPMWTPLPTDPSFDRLGIERVPDAERDTVVIDYSSPNVAKQMHVGHLRSTIIGDTIARVLEFEGHKVIRQNHVGDWGTPMGMVIHAIVMDWAEKGINGIGAQPNQLGENPGLAVALLDYASNMDKVEAAYKSAAEDVKRNPKLEEAFLDLTRALQAGDPTWAIMWNVSRTATLREAFSLYSKLGVTLGLSTVAGESSYDPLLGAVIDELRASPAGSSATTEGARAVCREDQGALCVFLERPDGAAAFRGPKGDPLPMLIRKSDGAYLYATTDLAAIAYRINNFMRQPVRFHSDALPQALQSVTRFQARGGGLGATRILYVVGAPQKLHFEMLFAVVRALGWTRPGDGKREVRLEHVAFGSVLGEDRKMLRTRSGESVKLKELLEEAVQRAEKLVRETEADPAKRRGFSDDEIKRIAEVVGISAVKYADLSQNRNTDYVFSWDKMLALQGNTAPYMLYAYARIRSIHRKGTEQEAVSPQPSAIRQEPSAVSYQPSAAERTLALAIARLPETIDAVADSLLPSVLCDYLYDLAGKFMTFYEACPVLQAPDEATKASRLRLCDLTARALRLGLALLGIPTLERM